MESCNGDVPEGEWMVLRFGHVPTGGVTKHSRANMKGLECDGTFCRGSQSTV